MVRNSGIVAIIQARTGSTRLPGKVLMEICGKPLLQHVIERARKSHLIGSVVVATTSNPSDQAVVRLARKCGAEAFAGSENDVLDRYFQAAKKFKADVIVRITADDPFKDPVVIDRIITHFLANRQKLDYASNTIKPTYPLGLDTEVFSFSGLQKAWNEATDPYDREHVTPYFYRHPELFRLANIENGEDLSSLRWTLDYEADLRFAREIYSRLYREGDIFLMNDILRLLEKEPQLAEINKDPSGVAR